MIGDPILESFVRNFAQEHELTATPSDELFEHFANYAVLSRLYSGTVQLEALETNKAFGIDGVAVIANDVLVTTRDEVKDVARHSLDASFVFVQTKTSAKFDTGDVLKFVQAVDDFFTDPPKIPPNDRMKHLRDLRKAVFEQGIKMDVPPSCELYYVCTGIWNNDAMLINLIENEKAKLTTQRGFAEVKFIPVDLEKLKGYYKSIKQRVVRQFSFEKRVVVPKIDAVNQAYIGVIPAKEYIKLISDPDGNLERGLFYENVRDFLGDNPVNLEIAAAVRNSTQDKFVLLNNGVTIVARSITPVGDDFTLRDYQIVNGCQTSHVLYYNRQFLTDSLFLPVKLIATENQEVTNKVIKATNRQTEVKQEAFIALEPFQKQLEEYFASVQNISEKLYYERRSKQYEADDTPKSRVVSITMQTKSFVAMFLAEPHSTHRYYGELLQAYWNIKKKMFQNDHDPECYYLSAYTMFLIERAFRDGRIPSTLRLFKYHFSYLVRVLVAGRDEVTVELGARKTREFNRNLHDFLSVPVQFNAALAEIGKVITTVLEREGSKYGGEPERRSTFTADIRSALAASAMAVSRPTPPVRPKLPVRSSSPKPERTKGTIKRLREEFGFIADDSGQEYFFHRSQWKSATNLHEEQEVEFTPTLGQKGMRAVSVHPVQKAVART